MRQPITCENCNKSLEGVTLVTDGPHILLCSDCVNQMQRDALESRLAKLPPKSKPAPTAPTFTKCRDCVFAMNWRPISLWRSNGKGGVEQVPNCYEAECRRHAPTFDGKRGKFVDPKIGYGPDCDDGCGDGAPKGENDGRSK